MLMLIDGQWVGARETIPVHDPYTGEVIDTVPRGTAEDVDRAVSAALEGYRENRASPAGSAP
jgi:phenylacetaldehyde dehydrogenase